MVENTSTASAWRRRSSYDRCTQKPRCLLPRRDLVSQPVHQLKVYVMNLSLTSTWEVVKHGPFNTYW